MITITKAKNGYVISYNGKIYIANNSPKSLSIQLSPVLKEWENDIKNEKKVEEFPKIAIKDFGKNDASK